MIWSNLAFQWCNDLEHTFAEMYRILRTDGLLMFSTFGPDTLKELRQSFAQADTFSHVNRFIDMARYRRFAGAQRFFHPGDGHGIYHLDVFRRHQCDARFESHRRA